MKGQPGNDAPPILAVEQLSVTLGVQQVLHSIDLVVPERGIIAVLGSNGVGKTTLMRTLSGIYRPTAGTIRCGDRVVSGLPSHEIVAAGISQAPEGRQIFSTMTVRDNLYLGGGPYGLADLDRICALFPVLSERLGQQAGSLSGGEQQMLCIGRALMRRPRVLLLDEPSLGLAPRVVRQIFALLAQIRDDGLSILVVEQNVRLALGIADRASVMEGGRIVLEGPARELANDPRVTAAYLGGQVVEGRVAGEQTHD